MCSAGEEFSGSYTCINHYLCNTSTIRLAWERWPHSCGNRILLCFTLQSHPHQSSAYTLVYGLAVTPRAHNIFNEYLLPIMQLNLFEDPYSTVHCTTSIVYSSSCSILPLFLQISVPWCAVILGMSVSRLQTMQDVSHPVTHPMVPSTAEKIHVCS